MAFSAGAIPSEWDEKLATDGAPFAGELTATIESLPNATMISLGFLIHAYLEVCIEQGPSLKANDTPIGIVGGNQGTRWLDVAVTGQTAHTWTQALPTGKIHCGH